MMPRKIVRCRCIIRDVTSIYAPCTLRPFLCLIESGRLMARYCVAFETMKNFFEVKGDEDLETLVRLQLHVHVVFMCIVILFRRMSFSTQLEKICKSQEFSDVTLRTNEKRALNTLNKDKNHATIR